VKVVRLFIGHCGTILAALACTALTACSTVKYYTQAIAGQAEILTKARPVSAVMRDPRVDARTKRKLALSQEARHFAQERLDLPADRQFGTYTDLGRRYVTWVVYAAPEFSVEGKTWWYPLVGRLEYRGYFSEKAAKEEAARLKALGYDVHVGGVEAYSTLGWFHDPVLNTFFHQADSQLADVIFHELTHTKVFLPGDTDFNEAFATANAEDGVRRWLKSTGDARTLAQYETGCAKDREIVRLLLRTRATLKEIYADRTRMPDDLRREKAAVFSRMRGEYAHIRKRWRGESRYDRAFEKPWNNARLNTVATYYDLVPGFERMLRQHGGDLRAFHASVSSMRTLTKPERRALLGRGSVKNPPRDS
jgi:predicted aminopeptidase